MWAEADLDGSPYLGLSFLIAFFLGLVGMTVGILFWSFEISVVGSMCLFLECLVFRVGFLFGVLNFAGVVAWC